MFFIFVLFSLQPTTTQSQPMCTQKFDHYQQKEPPCRPRPVVKHTDYLRKVTPRAITVSECSGYSTQMWGHRPQNYMCVPTNVVEFQVEVCSFDGSSTTMTFRNHTSCSMECVCQLNSFRCPTGKVFPNVPCPDGMVYDEESCKCRGVDAKPNHVKRGEDEGVGTVSIEALVMSLCGELLVILLTLLTCNFLRRNGGFCASYAVIPGTNRGADRPVNGGKPESVHDPNLHDPSPSTTLRKSSTQRVCSSSLQ